MTFIKGYIPWNKGLPKEKQPLFGKHLAPCSEETKKKISISLMGKKRPPFSEETKKKMSKNHVGHPISEKAKRKIGSFHKGNQYRLGHKPSEETKRKMSLSNIGKHTKLNPITPRNKLIRHGIEFRLWREAVFARDNWVCQKCEEKGIYLHPHHIRNFAEDIDLRFSISNGITFCQKCHKEFHKKYRFKNNNLEQIKEFINI